MWLLLVAAVLLPVRLPGVAAAACPVLQPNGCCDQACQIAYCQRLVGFADALTSPDEPWVNPWPTGPGACSAPPVLPGSPAAQQPPWYCRWYGISCGVTPAISNCSSTVPGQSISITALDLSANNLNGSINDLRVEAALAMLHDCGLVQLAMGGGDLGVNGTLSTMWGRFTNLQELAITKSFLHGTIPAYLGNLKQLKILDLTGDFLNGTIPSSLAKLTQLRVLNLAYNGWTDMGYALNGTIPAALNDLRQLTQLSLELNQLSGTLPPLCSSGRDALQVVSLRNNRLTGSVEMLSDCEQLRIVDLSANRFTGPLPVPLDLTAGNGVNGTSAGLQGYNSTWSSLLSLRLGGNAFTGTLPESLFRTLPVLTVLDVYGNRLKGSISRSVVLLHSVEEMDLSGNQLTGELPAEMASLSRLNRLSLSDNCRLTGTISPNFRLARTLHMLSWSNTSLVGPIPGATAGQEGCSGAPAGLGRLFNLQLVDMQRTLLQANCGPSGCTKAEAALPWYLSFTQGYEQPRQEPEGPDVAHMLCKRVQMNQYCIANNGPFTINSTQNPASWLLSPSYYHYTGCKCESGYREVWEVIQSRFSACGINTTVPLRRLTCEKKSSLGTFTVATISVIVSVVGVLLLLYCAYVSYYGSWGLPKKLQKAAVNMTKRLEGAPRSGQASLVVTDIEGYSALVSSLPIEVMHSAMAVHNTVMRKAAWQHYGFVLGQEGDSFIVAFRAAVDAVSFCLQVQQALQKAPWPAELLPSDSTTIRQQSHSTNRRPFSFLRNIGSSTGEGRSFTNGAPSGMGWAGGDPGSADSRAPQRSALSACEMTGDGQDTSGHPKQCKHRLQKTKSWRELGLHRASSNQEIGGEGVTEQQHVVLHVQGPLPDGVVGSQSASAAQDMVRLTSIREGSSHSTQPDAKQQQYPPPLPLPPLPQQNSSTALSELGSAASASKAGGRVSLWRRLSLGGSPLELQLAPRQQQPDQQQQQQGLGVVDRPPAAPSATSTIPPGNGVAHAAAGMPSGNGSTISVLPLSVGTAEGMNDAVAAADLAGAGRAAAAADRQPQQMWPGVAAAQQLPGRYPRGSSPNDASPTARQQLPGVSPSGSSFYPSIPGIAANGPDSADAAAAVAGDAAEPIAAVAAELIKGLKVRIGVATGELHGEEDITSSRLLDIARVVSDAGAGGQLLLDSTTFLRIKDRLGELGAVKADGLDKRQLSGTPNGWLARLIGRWKPVMWSEAVVLDMGVYSIPSLRRTKGTAPAAGSPAAGSAGGDSGTGRGTAGAPSASAAAASGVPLPMKGPSPRQAARENGGTAGAVAGATGAAVTTPRGGSTPPGAPGNASPPNLRRESISTAPRPPRPNARKQTSALMSWYLGVTAEGPDADGYCDHSLLHLYQVLPPSLLQRAKLFGNKLALPEGTLCHDLPYFSAPAAAVMQMVPAVRAGPGTVEPNPPSQTAGIFNSVVNSITGRGRSLEAGPGGASAAALAAAAAEGSGTAADGAAAAALATAATGANTNTAPAAVAAATATLSSASAAASAGAAAGGGSVGGPSPVRGMQQPWPTRSSGSFKYSVLPRSRSTLQAGNIGVSSVWSGLLSLASKRQHHRTAVPPVTFVFCAVEGTKLLKTMMLAGLQLHHTSLRVAAVMRQALLMVNAHHSAALAAAGGGSQSSVSFGLDHGGSGTGSLDKMLAWGPAGAAAGLDAAGASNAGSTAGFGDAPPVHGGYFCRELLGDMKYMLAFGCPEVAAAWCLLVQDLLMWQDWSPQLLALPQFKEEWSGGVRGLGQLLFRGPRIRMGICSGPPQSVIPDHSGRADYLGAAVNRAARLQDACAHGGQVVCEASLADYLAAVWQKAAADRAAAEAQEPAGKAAAGGQSWGGITPPLQEGQGAQAVTRAADAAAARWQQPQQQVSAFPELVGAATAAMPGLPPLPRSKSPFILAAAAAPGGEVLPPSAIAEGRLSGEHASSGIGAGTAQHQQVELSVAAQQQAGRVVSPEGQGSSLLSPFWAMQQIQAPAGVMPRGSGQLGMEGPASAAAVFEGDEPEGRQQQQREQWQQQQQQVQQWLQGQAPAAPAVPPGAAAIAALLAPAASMSAAGMQQQQQQQQVRSSQGSSHQLQHARSAVLGSANAAQQQDAVVLSLSALKANGGGDGGMGCSAGGATASLAGGVGGAAQQAALLEIITSQLTPTEVTCPLYLNSMPTAQYDVLVQEVGLFYLKGDPGPTEVVQLSLSHLNGRLPLLPPEPPKGKGQCLEARGSNCVHVIQELLLPAAAAQAQSAMLPSLRVSGSMEISMRPTLLRPGNVSGAASAPRAGGSLDALSPTSSTAASGATRGSSMAGDIASGRGFIRAPHSLTHGSSSGGSSRFGGLRALSFGWRQRSEGPAAAPAGRFASLGAQSPRAGAVGAGDLAPASDGVGDPEGVEAAAEAITGTGMV